MPITADAGFQGFVNVELRSSNLIVAALACILVPNIMRARAAERSVYLYDIQNVADAKWLRLLNKWQQFGVERAIVSLEAGPKFLLDDPQQSARLTQLFSLAVRFGIRIEVLILQDPSWALDPRGARRRLHAIGEFNRSRGDLIDAVQIDVEVYAPSASFPHGDGWAKYAILVAALREELSVERSRLRLNAALPWWLPVAVADHDLKAVYRCLDGIVLMVYDDPGGTPIAKDLGTFREKVQPVIENFPEDGPAFRVAIAAYEQPSQLALWQFAQELDSLLSDTPRFSGVAYFREIPGK